MTRIDVPTLKCDRCQLTTQDTAEMVKFMKLNHDHMSGRDEWDLCSHCRVAFRKFMANEIAYSESDWTLLGEDVSGVAMYGGEPPHEDGRQCSYHYRLQTWVFYNYQTDKMDLKCLRNHGKEF